MTLGSILLATALLLLVGVLVMRPLLLPAQRGALPLTVRERLSAEKESLLTQIRALDFDYETGALPEETYQRERLFLMQAAAEKLRLLDGLPEVASVEERIESAVAALRGNSGQLVVNNERSAIGGEILVVERENCPKCGKRVTENDKFCRECGEQLHVTA